jgi:hypothetical protein
VHGVHHDVQRRVQKPAGLFRVEALDQLGRAFEVSKQHRHLFAFAFQARTGLDDFFGQMGRGIRQRRPLLVGGLWRSWRRGRAGGSGPDEAMAVVLDDLWVSVEEFLRERLQVVVVQTKLQLEGTIGHAAASLEHSQRLVQHLLEGHRRPSTPLAALDGPGIPCHACYPASRWCPWQRALR